MSLPDNDIIELSELCNAAVDQRLTEAQRDRLSSMLASSEDARRFYVRMMGLSASLCGYAGEMQADDPDMQPIVAPAGGWNWRRLSAVGLAVAATLALIASVAVQFVGSGDGAASDETVARLTGTKDCRWSTGAAAIAPGDHLRKGQRIRLESGVAEITFDSGALVVLTGPADLALNSAWDATLHRGTLRANVPPQAVGFRISNPSVEVVDLGTEFSVVTDDEGVSEVFVLKGSVEAVPVAPMPTDTAIVLTEHEARRFSASEVTDVARRQEKLDQFIVPAKLVRLTSSAAYVHWALDRFEGGHSAAEAGGLAAGRRDLQIVPPSTGSVALTPGRWENALSFDGSSFAKATMPGAGMRVRTIAFWVKVETGAALSSAAPIVSWKSSGKKRAGAPPVEIGWNHDPKEGVLGALRTDFAKGSTIGTTALRDGEWHHVAVVLVTGRDGEHLQVNQYIDGRLEQTTGRPGKRRMTVASAADEAAESGRDTLWIGRRAGAGKHAVGGFRGQVDEFYLVDRALLPHEIVALMTTNKITTDQVAADGDADRP